MGCANRLNRTAMNRMAMNMTQRVALSHAGIQFIMLYGHGVVADSSSCWKSWFIQVEYTKSEFLVSTIRAARWFTI
jgi:hypothetical protein